VPETLKIADAPAPKTEAEHGETLHALVRLQLAFVWHWSCRHPREAVAETLERRVDLWRKTDLNPGGLVHPGPEPVAAWTELRERLSRLCRVVGSAAAFAEAGHALLRPRIDARVPADYARERAGDHLKAYGGSSLRYHLDTGPQGRVAFLHVANAIAPRSIFAVPGYVEDCLRRLSAQARSQGVETLRTVTWLNDLPRFLDCFPASWRDHLGLPDPDVQWHYGYWGQFLNARGCLNETLAERCRSRGDLPYGTRASWCTLSDLDRHLVGRPCLDAAWVDILFG